MLSAVNGDVLKPDEPNDPFGPMVTLVNGSRSAIPSDFRGCIECLADMAHRAANPVLLVGWRTYVGCWTERKESWRASLFPLTSTCAEDKKWRAQVSFRGGQWSSSTPCARVSVQSLSIGRTIGWDKPETMAARELVVELRKRAIEKQALMPINWFCDLDLDFAISDPGEIAPILTGCSQRRPLRQQPTSSSTSGGSLLGRTTWRKEMKTSIVASAQRRNAS